MTGRPGPRPPAVVGWLLDRLDPTGVLRGDLDEEYLRYRYPEGSARARVWYWGQALRSLPALVRAGVPRPGGGPGVATDLAQGFRSVRRRPAGSALVVITLGLGLGVNAAVFSLLHSVVLRPLPFDREEELVRIHPDELFYTDLAGANALIDRTSTLVAALPWGRTLLTFEGDGPAEEVRGARVDWRHFDVLGVRPLIGRAFTEADARTWPSTAVVLSHELWVRRFGSAPEVVGRSVPIGGRMQTIVGVMPPAHLPMEPDWEAWAPLPLDAAAVSDLPLALNARLRPGVDLGEARDDVRGAFAQVGAAQGSPIDEADLAAIRVVPLRDHLLGSVDRSLFVLYGAVLAVLLLAGANVANLRAAQGVTRGRELAVRASLGAGRSRILGQLAAEATILALLGGVVAWGLAWGLHGWALSRMPVEVPRGGQWSMGPVTVIYTLLASLVVGLLSGLLPALHLRESRSLAAHARPGHGARERISAALVAGEVAGAVILLVAAGLMLRSFSALRSVDPGFDTRGVVAVRVAPPPQRVEGPDQTVAWWDEVLAATASIPGVEAEGGILFLPMTPGGAWSAVRAEGAGLADEELPSGSFRIVAPGYFEALGVPLVAGRTLQRTDGADTEPVAVINESLARLAFGDADPVGRTLEVGRGDPDRLRVVGVVADVRQSALREEAWPEFYRPLAQRPTSRMYLVARGGEDTSATLAALQRTVREVDAQAVLSRPTTLEGLVADDLSSTRLVATLLAIFGGVAILLGGVGVYGVTASAVARRRGEIGIRKALGAPGGRVARAAMARALMPVGVGLLLGAIGAAALSGLLSTLLFGVEARDPLTFLIVPLLLGAVATAAVTIPTLRAARVDPVQTLRG